MKLAAGLLLSVWGLPIAALLGCQSDAALHEMDPDLNRMLEVPRYDPYEKSDFFDDRMAMRRPPRGTVPYKKQPLRLAVATGMTQEGYLTDFPLELTLATLQQGRRHYDGLCAACHGTRGTGDTVVASHMLRPPPSLHEPRIQQLAVGKVYRVIERGYGYMPSYASHLDVPARWAVVAYVKALQRSQRTRLDELPEELAQKAKERLP